MCAIKPRLLAYAVSRYGPRMAKDRFERGGDGGHAKIQNREESRAELLGRMWSLFGPPDRLVDGGFSYNIRDRESGRELSVYAGPTGPAYGGPLFDQELFVPVVEAFDHLLDHTPLADCSLEIPTEGGHDVIGVERGAPFDRQIRAPIDRVAEARELLASNHPDPMLYYLALVRLEEQSPGEHELLIALWHRSLAAAIAELDRELAKPSPSITTLAAVIEATLPSLEQTAQVARVDYAEEVRPFATKLAAARRAIAASS
jgi:hypothetical protein